MRFSYLILCICISSFSCAQNNEEQKSFSMDQKSIPLEQQITYAIHINAKTPYEIYIDDIPLPDFGRVYESGMNATLELNPYLLKNGIHELKVRYLPRPDAEDGLIQPSHIISSKDSKWNIFFVRYIKNNEDPLGYEGEIDYGNSELKVIAPPTPVPIWEQLFELNIKDLPYELKGWSESEDLSKMNENKMKNEVFEYFEFLRNILNDGKVKSYIEVNKNRNREISISTYNYMIENSLKKNEEDVSECQNNMWEINPEEYIVKIYANGRLATIERINKFKNSGLIVETETDYYEYNFLLHKPKNTDSFEIIR